MRLPAVSVLLKEWGSFTLKQIWKEYGIRYKKHMHFKGEKAGFCYRSFYASSQTPEDLPSLSSACGKCCTRTSSMGAVQREEVERTGPRSAP